IDAIEKGASQRDAFVVLRHRAAANTWAETFLDFEPYAPRRARKNLEQLGLVGEIHPLLRGAVAQTEHVVELTNRLAHAHGSHKGPVVNRRVVLAGAAHDDELRRRSACDLDEAVVPRVAL